MKKINKWILAILLSISPVLSYSKDLSVVLMYHHVSHYENDMNVSPELFKEQMNYLYENNYNVVSAIELVKAFKEKKPLPPKSVVITFDDGWKNQRVAMEILKEYNFPAMFALITKYQYSSSSPYFTKKSIKNIINEDGNLFTFVDHSQTHRIKDYFENPEIDVPESKSQITDITGKFTPIYVYPYGKTDLRLKNELIKNKYIAAFGVYGLPVNVKKNDIFNIHRFLINDSITMERFKEIVSLSD